MPPCPSSSSSSPMDQTQTQTLIPKLPNDISALILAHIPISHHSRLKPTCKQWNLFFSHKSLFSFRRLSLSSQSLSNLLCIFPTDPSVSNPLLFDPLNRLWSFLPHMPCNPHVYGLCNFGAVAVDRSVFVIGGSAFDTRSFPMDRPSCSSVGFRFDFAEFRWERIADMLVPRGSFACGTVSGSGRRRRIVVAGGGSRHTLFGAAGSRMESAEVYDVARDEWAAVEGLPRFRAGCVGFFTGGEEREFWVMGGYGESRTVSGVFPVDEYYRDALVMELEDGGGGRWREVGDMWGEGERRRLGKIVLVGDEVAGEPGIFMLDGGTVLRYDMALNHWWKETSLPREAPDDSSVGFVALNGELYIMTLLNAFDIADTRRPCQNNKSNSLFVQTYHPRKKVWSSFISKPPLQHQLDFRTAVMCTIRL